MTKISYIHGIGQTDPSENKDRATLVPPRSFINYTALTDGELKLTLLAEQANILAAMYPENKEIQRSRQILIDSLYKGLHNGALPGGIFTGNQAKVVSEIRRAQTETRPAIGKLYGRRNPAKGIGDPLIPLEDCKLIEHEDPKTGWIWTEYDAECERNNQFKGILNTHLEKAGHHILYEFMTNVNAQPGVVITKTVNHKAGTSTIHETTKLNRDNIRLWIRNGIIRHNAKGAAGALQPEATIQALKENAGESIGVFPVAALVAIITAIATAVSAAAQLVAASKQAQPASAALWNQLQGIGTGTWGPEGPDWQVPGGGTTSNNLFENDLAMPLLIGAGAYLLLK